MTRRKRAGAPRPGRGRREPAPASETRSSPVRQALVVLVAVKVAGLVLLFDPASAAPFEGPKTVLSLATAALLGPLVALLLVGADVRALLRPRLHLAVALFAGANVLAALFAQDQYVALFGGGRRLGLAFVLDMAILYLAVALGYRSMRDWAVLAAAVGLAGALAMGYGTLQSLGADPIMWADDVRVRPPSTFGNPDKFGHFLGATLAAAAAMALVPARGMHPAFRAAAALYGVAALVMAGIVATRGTLVGLAAALPVIGILYLAASRGVVRSRALLTLAVGAFAVVVLASALVLATPLGERVRSGFADIASQQRGIAAAAAIGAFIDRPLVGHGPDNFGVIYPRYRPATASPLIGQDSAHSSLLQALATTGLLGALGLVAVAALTLLLLWRATATHAVAGPLLAGAAAYWAQSLVALGSVSIDWVGWVAAGGAASLTHAVDARRQRRIATVVQAAAVAAGVALALTGYAALQAGRESYSARSGGASDRALQAASRAVELDRGRAEYWFTLGQVHGQRRALAEAAVAYRGAAERAPYVSAYWSNLAVTLADLVVRGDQSLGGKGAALDAARRAIEADPASPRPHVIFAVVSRALGDPVAALEAVTIAIRLDRTDPEHDLVAADLALRVTDTAAARAALERIITVKDSAVLRVALAQTSLKLNDLASARVHLRRAVELDPQNAAARDLSRQIGP